MVLTHVLHGINGCVDDGVDVQFAWSFIRGNEPIEVDPEQIPDHRINGIREKFPRRCARVMKIVGSGATSQISDGGPGSLDLGGTA